MNKTKKCEVDGGLWEKFNGLKVPAIIQAAGR